MIEHTVIRRTSVNTSWLRSERVAQYTDLDRCQRAARTDGVQEQPPPDRCWDVSSSKTWFALLNNRNTELWFPQLPLWKRCAISSDIFCRGLICSYWKKRFAIHSKQRLLEFSSPGVCHAVVPGTLLLGKFHKNAQLGITIIEHINKKVNKL